MGVRDTYNIHVFCGPCKTQGAVHLSEDDYPYASPLRRIEQVEGPFWANFTGVNTIEVTCKKCRKVIRRY